MNGRGKVLFRVEAGPRIGLGHLRRSLSLAKALEETGMGGHFLINGPDFNREFVSRLGFSCEALPEPEAWAEADLSKTRKTADQLGSQVVLVDSPFVSASYIAGLRQGAGLSVVRDDLGRIRWPADLVINGNADAERIAYARNGSRTRFLLGPQYIALPEEFWVPRRRIVRERVEQILVVLGGADLGNRMPGLIRLLDALPGSFELTVVVGPFFDNGPEIRACASGAAHRVQLAESPASLSDLIWEADVAVSAAGQTLYELACSGCPVVAFQMGEDQSGQLQAMAEAGCVQSLDHLWEEAGCIKLQETVRILMGDRGRRAAMAEAGQRLVDGQGARRIAAVIAQALSCAPR